MVTEMLENEEKVDSDRYCDTMEKDEQGRRRAGPRPAVAGGYGQAQCVGRRRPRGVWFCVMKVLKWDFAENCLKKLSLLTLFFR